MNNAGRKIFFVMLIVYALAFLVFLGWSYFNVPPIRLDGPRRSWIIGNSIVLFARNIIPLHLAAVLFGFSLFFSYQRPGEGRQGVSPHLKFLGVFFLALVFACAALLEAGMPLGMRMRDEPVARIQQADKLRVKARDANTRGQLGEARRYLRYALALFPEDEDLRRELDVADRAVKFSGDDKQKKNGVSPDSPILLNMTFDDFLSRAKNAFDREDYISAEYYANFALRMNSDHPAPRRIIALSREKMADSLSSRDLRADMDFFRRKQTGADILAGGKTSDIIEAYRFFQALAGERPGDPDVRYYLRLANTELRKAAFLLSEIPLTAFEMPREGVVLINRTGAWGKEFLYIGQVLKTEAAYYALDIEALGLGPGGELLYRFGAPYGKFANNALLMRCVDDEGPADYGPTYHAGKSPDENRNILPCEAAPEDLVRLCAGDSAYRSFALWSLLETARVAPLFGISPVNLYQAFFSRLSLPFSFFVLTFFAAAWGLRLRSRYAASPPLLCFLFLPLLPFITSVLFQIYHYSLGVIQGFLLEALGFYSSLAAFCVVQGIILFAALMVFSQQLRR